MHREPKREALRLVVSTLWTVLVFLIKFFTLTERSYPSLGRESKIVVYCKQPRTSGKFRVGVLKSTAIFKGVTHVQHVQCAHRVLFFFFLFHQSELLILGVTLPMTSWLCCFDVAEILQGRT